MIRRSFRLILTAALMAAPGLCDAARAAGLITDVNISPDFKRLTIETEGSVGEPSLFEIDGPPRLVIDFDDGDLGDAPRKTELKNKPVREIRTGRLQQGARVVVEFGRYEIPEYRIKKIGACYIVFFGRFRQLPRADSDTDAAVRSISRDPNRVARSPSASIHSEPGSKLFIKSAEAIGDLIVLEVFERGNPSRSYRVDIGIDLDQRGFTTANIRRAKSSRHTKRNAPSGRDAGWSAEAARGNTGHAPPLSRAARRILSMQ